MKVVYVAGPFRASTRWGVEQNVRRAEEAGISILKLGAMPVVPHLMGRFLDGDVDDNFVLLATQELLARCDAIYLLEGWGHSKGAVAEHQVACERRIRVLTTMDQLSAWVRQPEQEVVHG